MLPTAQAAQSREFMTQCPTRSPESPLFRREESTKLFRSDGLSNSSLIKTAKDGECIQSVKRRIFCSSSMLTSRTQNIPVIKENSNSKQTWQKLAHPSSKNGGKSEIMWLNLWVHRLQTVAIQNRHMQARKPIQESSSRAAAYGRS